MTTKTYSSKSNAIRGFRATYAEAAANLTNPQIATDYVDEDEPGKWVLIDPALVADVDEEMPTPEAAPEAPTPVAPAAVQVHNVALPKEGLDGKCPHCAKATRGGNNVTDFSEMAPSAQRDTNQQFTCNSCAGEWGPVVDKPKLTPAGRVRSTVGTPVKLMWEMLDAEPGLARKVAVERGIALGVSPNTAATQFQWWRKARGLVKAK